MNPSDTTYQVGVLVFMTPVNCKMAAGMRNLPARKATKISQKVKRQWRMPPTKRGAMKAESTVS